MAGLAVIARVARGVAEGDNQAARAQVTEQPLLGGGERGPPVAPVAGASTAGEGHEHREQRGAPHPVRSSAAPTIVSASIPWWR